MKSKDSVYVPRFSMDFGDREDRQIHQALRDEYFFRELDKKRADKKKNNPKKD